MNLVITEKPSVAKHLTEAIGEKTEKKEGFFVCGDYYVTWCLGHLITTAMPEDYSEEYKTWNVDKLPIVPAEWKYTIIENSKKQYSIVKKLLWSKDVTKVICATDAGREGELIFRLVYNQAGCTKPAYRLWCSTMEKDELKKALYNTKPISDYDNLYRAAACRQKADWLYGINFTRYYSVVYGEKLTVGRVQTPTLSMIVRRQNEIDNFVPQKYYNVTADLGGFNAVAKVDTEDEADELIKKCRGQDAYVAQIESKDVTNRAPLPYNLTALQRDANKKYGYTASETLAIAQDLYEAELISYPRTDSQYINESMIDSTRSLIDKIVNLKLFGDVLPYPFKKVEVKKIADDKKVSDHHALIPTKTVNSKNFEKLNEKEKNIILLICGRLLLSVLPDKKYKRTQVVFDIENETFKSTGTELICAGYTEYEKSIYNKEEKENNTVFPAISTDSIFVCRNLTKEEKYTSPPLPYTDDTLLSAMENASKFLMGEELKSTLNEVNGIGTPATRAAIIDALVTTGYIRRDKKNILPTDKGKTLCDVALDNLKSPQMTAEWETKLKNVESGSLRYSDFETEIESEIKNYINSIKVFAAVPGERREIFKANSYDSIGNCPICGKQVLSKTKGYMCSNKDCNFVIWKTICGKGITVSQAKKLIKDGKTNLIKGFKSKAGKNFDAYLLLEDGKTKFVFD